MCGRQYAKGACAAAAVATMMLLLPSVVSAESENGARRAGPPTPDAAVKERQASDKARQYRASLEAWERKLRWALHEAGRVTDKENRIVAERQAREVRARTLARTHTDASAERSLHRLFRYQTSCHVCD